MSRQDRGLLALAVATGVLVGGAVLRAWNRLAARRRRRWLRDGR